MLHLVTLVLHGHVEKTGLPTVHPIVRFAREPDLLGHTLSLDDTVFWGALPMLIDAPDPLIRDLATRLRDRRLPKCIDIHQRFVSAIAPEHATTVEDRDGVGRTLAAQREQLAPGVPDRGKSVARRDWLRYA